LLLCVGKRCGRFWVWQALWLIAVVKSLACVSWESFLWAEAQDVWVLFRLLLGGLGGTLCLALMFDYCMRFNEISLGCGVFRYVFNRCSIPLLTGEFLA